VETKGILENVKNFVFLRSYRALPYLYPDHRSILDAVASYKDQHGAVSMGANSLRTTDRVVHEITSGDGLNLAAAARRFPGHRGGSCLDPSSVWRWICRGIRGANGRIKLEAARVAGRVLTSEQAITRFILAQALTPADRQDSPVRSPSQRERAADAAARELDRLGI
jgi:Protein of unknown function (DUF1580)